MFILLSCFIMVSCGPGLSDYTKSLGKGFVYSSNNSLDKYISYQGKKYIPNLVVDYDVANNYLAVLRLEAVDYECPKSGGLVSAFTNRKFFYLVNLSNGEFSVSQSFEEWGRLLEKKQKEFNLDYNRFFQYLKKVKSSGVQVSSLKKDCKAINGGTSE